MKCANPKTLLLRPSLIAWTYTEEDVSLSMTLLASCVAPATSTSTIDNSTVLWVSLEKDVMVFPEMLSSKLLDLPMLKKKNSKKRKPTKAISRENKSEIRTTLI